MPLVKHSPGKPLTTAELQQRKNAARARWAAAGTGATLGALAGAGTAAWSVHRAVPVRTAAAIAAVDARVDANTERLRQTILDRVRHRTSKRPGPEGAAPVVGAADGSRNHLIYDYQIAALRRRLRRTADAARVKDIELQITRLETMKARRPFLIGRSGTDRFPTRAQAIKRLAELDQLAADMSLHGLEMDTGRIGDERQFLENQVRAAPVRVGAHVERRYRGGETTPGIERRIKAAVIDLRAHRRRLLTQLATRTTSVREGERGRAVQEITAGLRAHLMRTTGKGALLGAGIGLTASGLAILAHHLAIHGGSKRKAVRKFEPLRPQLAKARRATPEDQIGVGLGSTFRQWIDRLLGKNVEPMNLGDGIAEGMGPGIIRAFAEGARDPPIDREGSDPKSWIEVDFDSLNPSVRRHMAEYALDRIVQLTDQQREAIRTALMDQSVMRGIGPYEVARTIRQVIGLTSWQQSIVESFRVGLQQLDPRVLERKLRDKRYDSVIQRAIETNEPLTAEQIQAMTDAYHRRMLALRSRTIARTEALRATSYGGLARAQEVLNDHPDLDVTKRWLATKDERTRDTHRDLDGREVEGMTTQFITSKGNHIRWPLDDQAAADEVINCRCTLQFVFKPKRGQLQAVAV